MKTTFLFTFICISHFIHGQSEDIAPCDCVRDRPWDTRECFEYCTSLIAADFSQINSDSLSLKNNTKKTLLQFEVKLKAGMPISNILDETPKRKLSRLKDDLNKNDLIEFEKILKNENP